MKSNPSPSAPLNLCAPVGVTGTTLPGVVSMTREEATEHLKSLAMFEGEFKPSTKGCAQRFRARFNVKTRDAIRKALNLVGDAATVGRIGELANRIARESPPASPVKDTPAETIREVVIKHDTLKHSYFVSYVTRSKGARYTAGQFDSRFTTLDEVKDWIKINPNLKLVEDAPASPVDSVPADPDDMNERRSEWAENAIREFMGESRTDRGDALSDLLSDFGHWADRNDTSLEAEIQRAAMHYNDETDGEGTQFSFLDASHAAKDAKIKALEEALADAIPTLEGDLKKTKEIAHLVPEIYADKAERISRLRAALALPCASQES